MTQRISATYGNHRGLIIPGFVLLLILATLPATQAGRIFGKSWKNIYEGGDQNFYQFLFATLIKAGSLQLMEFLMPRKTQFVRGTWHYVLPLLGPQDLLDILYWFRVNATH